MAADTLTSATNFYHSYFREFAKNDAQLASKLTALMAAKARPIEVGGSSRNATWEYQYSDGVGVGIGSEGGAFPTPQASAAANPVLGITDYFFSVEWTGTLISAGTSSKAKYEAGKQWSKKKKDELMERIKKTIARQAMWNGSFILGQIATLSTTANKQYFTVSTGGASPNHFEAGDLLTIRDAATGGTETCSCRVVGVDPYTGRIYVSTMAGASVGNYISLAAFYDQTVINGVRNLVDNDNTIQGIDRTLGASTYFRSPVIDNGGAAIGPSLVDLTRDTARAQNWAREDRKLIWAGNQKTRRWAALSTIGQVRFASISKQQVGTPSIEIGTADGTEAFMEDELFIDGEFYAMDPKSFIRAHPEGMDGPQLVEVGGNVILQKVGSSGYYDAYQILATWRGNYGIDESRCNVRTENFVSP